jgi:hypothetical protein
MRINSVTAAIVIVLTLAAAVHAAPAPPPQAAGDAANMFESRYDITLLTQPPGPSKTAPNLRVTPLPPGVHRSAAQHLRIIDQELARYSRGLLRISGVRQIAFVQSLANRSEVGVAFVDFAAGVMYWNLGYDSKDDYLRHAVHHELFHGIDLRLNGAIGNDDPAWLTLNDRGFKYGPGGHIVREGFKADHSDASPGFVSRYARTGAMEDKAETFSNMMRPDARQWLERQMERDAVLAAKVKHLQGIIDYHDRVNPDAPEEQALEQVMAVIRGDDPRALESFCSDPANRDALNAPGWGGRTPLHHALITASVRYAPQYIYRQVADLNAADDLGWTPLHVAAFTRNTGMVMTLIKRGADPQLKDKQGATPADWAKLRGYGDVVEAIRKTKFEPRRGPPGRGLIAPPRGSVTADEPRRQQRQ